VGQAWGPERKRPPAAAICVGAAVVGTLAWVAGAGWFALKRAATRGKNAAAANATAQRKTANFSAKDMDRRRERLHLISNVSHPSIKPMSRNEARIS